jgi:23S rRNA pseudouridine955/2504/2580 synthase
MNDAKAIVTNINILDYNPKADVTLLMIELKTGKSHQIRAHLSSLGYPIVGDVKYGSKTLNAIFNRKYGIKSQMLSSVLVVFPEGTETISARRFSAKPLKAFYKLFDIDSYL